MWVSRLLALTTAVQALPTPEDTDDNSKGEEFTLSNVRHQVCGGVYSSKDRPGPHESKIEIEFEKQPDSNRDVTLVVYAYRDIDHLGHPDKYGGYRRQYLCNAEAIADQFCKEEEWGQIIVDDRAGLAEDIVSKKISLNDPEKISYPVAGTDYYCVATLPLNGDFKYAANIYFQNSYGYLPGTEVHLVWFYAIQAIFYIVLCLAWGFFFWRYRHDSLPVQRYLSTLAIVMVIESLVVWGYYLAFNKSGSVPGTKVLLGFTALTGAARLAYTFLMLLIVCHGYSVVYPSLGRLMLYIRLLSGVIFATAFIYLLNNYYSSNGTDTDLFGLFALLPLVISVGAAYMWTLTSLRHTTEYLASRKQHMKVLMYKRVFWVLLGSAVAILFFDVLQMLEMLTQSMKDMISNHWRYKWVYTDLWPNFVYFCALTLIMALWWPSDNNRIFAMSQQLSQDDSAADEFEIGSLGGSDDEREPSPPPGPPPNLSSGPADTVFDADADHQLSDLEGDDTLHSAPTHTLRKDR